MEAQKAASVPPAASASHPTPCPALMPEHTPPAPGPAALCGQRAVALPPASSFPHPASHSLFLPHARPAPAPVAPHGQGGLRLVVALNHQPVVAGTIVADLATESGWRSMGQYGMRYRTWPECQPQRKLFRRTALATHAGPACGKALPPGLADLPLATPFHSSTPPPTPMATPCPPTWCSMRTTWIRRDITPSASAPTRTAQSLGGPAVGAAPCSDGWEETCRCQQ